MKTRDCNNGLAALALGGFGRRAFLRTSVAGVAAAATVPAFWGRTLRAIEAAASQPACEDPILVVVQMAGGNDGLNTVIPFGNDHYYRARPRLAIPQSEVLKLDESMGLHPALSAFRSLHDAGELGLVQGVGYPNPNRSHFRSTEIWQTASDANRVERHGWLGRYFDHACAGAEPTVGVNIGRQSPQAFASGKPLGISIDNPEQLRFVGAAGSETMMEKDAGSGRQVREESEGADASFERDEIPSGGSIASAPGAVRTGMAPLDYIERTAIDARYSVEQVSALLRQRRGGGQGEYPASPLGGSLRTVARLILGGLRTRVFYVSQGGYDTHTQQLAAQARLLGDLGASVKAFVDELKANKAFERILILTFSEFGRRVAENASAGTDHGAASVLFLAGSRLRPGLHGTYPSLAPGDLHQGDLKFTADFRSVYASVLESWLKVGQAPILGRRFATRPLFK